MQPKCMNLFRLKSYYAWWFVCIIPTGDSIYALHVAMDFISYSLSLFLSLVLCDFELYIVITLTTKRHPKNSVYMQSTLSMAILLFSSTASTSWLVDMAFESFLRDLVFYVGSFLLLLSLTIVVLMLLLSIYFIGKSVRKGKGSLLKSDFMFVVLLWIMFCNKMNVFNATNGIYLFIWLYIYVWIWMFAYGTKTVIF